ncbi:hypothetical protein FKG94_04410 [Exilibacterium tricleocarpae]|uniref:cGAS/DncV-like nucleotidyltransferase C-terminal helical domain-containing protein n=1 Tax=Exilibacterium tricleocarpae TaxID=2591008 RepID=A0A545U5M7_9GAMM|nr:hypothetical protein [Exilibacterium tricleocarpae]TQV84769.1 hypothetical protein FKG94_04410 [Exilibacterium tricleocarpae]
MSAQISDALQEIQQPLTDHSQKSKYRQVARIITHLRNELHQQHPQLAMPTSWMIECLVFNCPASDFNGDNWQDIVNAVLDRISDDMARDYGRECHYHQTDGTTPLFPNHDLYDETDAYHFCQRLSQYLEKDMG